MCTGIPLSGYSMYRIQDISYDISYDTFENQAPGIVEDIVSLILYILIYRQEHIYV